MTAIKRVSGLGLGGESAYVDGSITQSDLSPTIALSGMRNLIINGDMRINQRNSAVTSSGYTVDRWYQFKYGGGAISTTQDTASVPAGFKYALKTQCTVGISAGTSAATYHEQRVEGNNTIGLSFGTVNAKQLSLSFWVKSSLTGTHSVALGNSAEDRKYIAPYTVNAANTWEYKTISVTGDLSGTWLTDNGIGLRIYFVMASGTTDQQTTTTNQWFTDSGGMKIAASGTVDISATTGNIFAITGVQLEAGTQPTPFEQRPIGVELALCQRYYWRQGGNAYEPYGLVTFFSNSSNSYFHIKMPVKMRAAPTMNYSSLTHFSLFVNGVLPNPTSMTLWTSGSVSGDAYMMGVNISSGGSTGYSGWLCNASTTSGWIEFSSEL